MKKRYGKGVFVLLIAALVSAGGIGAACFFTQQAGEKKLQKEETEMLKAESGYLESGAPEKAGPYPEEQSKSGKKEKRENLQNPQDTETAGEKEQKAEEERKKKEEEKNREKRQSSG